MTPMPDIDLTQIIPVTDATVARLASQAAYDELADHITAGPVADDRDTRPAWPRLRRRLLLTGLSVAAVAGAAAVVAGLVFPGSGDSGADSPAAIHALSFVRTNGHITVVIRNPFADASWYNADFTRQHLDIKLTLIAASPSAVGTVTFASGDKITMINKPGCTEFGNPCPIGFTIPADFHGSAILGIGRPARPGEQYQSTGSAFSPGEALHGLSSQVFGHPLAQVLPVLAAHHITVAQCRSRKWPNGVCDPSHMPGTWYVQDAAPWASGEILLWIGPHRYIPPAAG